MKQILIFLILTIFLCASWTTSTVPKGCSGTYFIIGTAYKTNQSIIENGELTVKFGTDNNIIRTDKNGKFEISIAWNSACPSALSKEELRIVNERINPQFIYIIYANKEIKLENNWKKYGDCLPASKDAVTWKKDLNF